MKKALILKKNLLQYSSLDSNVFLIIYVLFIQHFRSEVGVYEDIRDYRERMSIYVKVQNRVKII
jgi:hypothetical protein